ncbi:MAG: hypothetical protein ACPG6R_10840 [Aequoribacter sp.]|uniref:hypothetical protein n=1 Tax=Aequoribacter sp. TaxID=2847771 RepID=UPI003C49902A
MKVRSVKFGRTKNIGNYQSARASCEIELEGNDTPEEAFAIAEAQVNEMLYGDKDRVEAAKQYLERYGYEVTE